MNYIDKIMEEMSDKASDSANYFGSVISLEDAQEILERHLKPQSEEVEIGEKNINIRWYNNYYSCKCWCHDIQEWYNYCPWCWKKIKRVD